MRGLPDYSKIRTHHRYELSSSAIVIVAYWVVCLVIAGLIVCSWSFAVEISTLSPGVIRPHAETSIIRTAFSGRIKQSLVKENQLVEAGDTLYSLETEALDIRREFLSNKVTEIQQAIEDLQAMTSKEGELYLHSVSLRQSWITFRQRVSEANARLKKAQSDYRRNAKLHNQMVIADAEFETYKFELEKAINDVELIAKTQQGQWQNELMNYERELRSTKAELAEVEREINSMVIVSPIAGTVQRFTGIYAGSIVAANQDLAQVSPETDLIVEAYASPGHIGLLHRGMKVRFMIDAFNYNQWGFCEGTVTDISNDVYVINDAPVFKIRCSLNKNYLELKNGYKGILRKGMSLKARFIVTERTLWQLLYDKTDNWLNPGR